MIRETVVVVVELTGLIVPIVVLEPVGQPVVIVIGIGSIPDAIVVVIVSVGRPGTADLVDIEDVVVIVVGVNGVVETVVVVVPGSV